MTGATGNIYCGLHEFADMSFFLHFLRPEDLFLDIGANVGSYTVLASKVVGCRSVCVEPVPQTYARLLRNIRVNAIDDRVNVANVGVGDSMGELWFSTDRDTMNRVVDSNYVGKKSLIHVVPIDQLLAERKTKAWKLDVEGFEFQALRGAQNALRSDELEAVLLEGAAPDVVQMMLDHGFKPAIYNAFNRTVALRDLSAKSRESNNVLWIRDFDAVRLRCGTAPAFKVLEFSI